MSITRHVVRLAIELLAGWLLVWVISFAVMNTMFYFGPWADPPGVNELHQALMALFPLVCLWRAYRRLRSDNARERSISAPPNRVFSPGTKGDAPAGAHAVADHEHLGQLVDQDDRSQS